jgi:hypothetical protein
MGFFDNTTTTQTSGTQTSQPWSPAQPSLGGLINLIYGNIPGAQITGNEQAALGGLQGLASAGNPYAGGISSLASSLLGGTALPDRSGIASGAYNTLQQQLTPFATQSTDPYSNPAVTNWTNTMSNDILNQIKSQYAGSGYSPVTSGDFGYNVGRGVSAGVAPTLAQAQQDLTSQKLGAINALYGAGNTTTGALSALDQARLASQLQGVGTSGDALTAAQQPFTQALQVAAAQRGIPVSAIGALSNLIVPMAGLGGTQTAQGTSTKTTPFNFGGLSDLFKGGTSSPASGMASGLSSLLGLL